jgi:MFS family permease
MTRTKTTAGSLGTAARGWRERPRGVGSLSPGSTLRALRHRNFRLFFAGQLVSLIGTWMQQVAMTWLVYDLTLSAWLLGVVGFASQLPAFFLSPFAGVLSDHWNRHRTLLLTQSLAMLQALALAALALTGSVAVWHVIVLGGFLGLVNAFDMTTRQAFMTQMLDDPQDLGNAIALNSSMVNGARLVGPALAGVLISLVGTGICFLLNGLSYLAVLAALLAMRLAPRPARESRPPLLGGILAGYRYAFGFPPIRSALLLLAVVSLMGASYSVLLPVFATEILGGGPELLGYLTAAAGVGALAAGIYLAARRTVLGLGRVIAFMPIVFGLALIGFAFSRLLAVSLGLLFVVGFAFMAQMASSNTVLQTIVEEDKRGRVMSFYTMAFLGMMPLGSLLAGGLASRFGAPSAVILGGATCLIAAACFAFRLPALRCQVRPIYIRMGILPEMAARLPADPMRPSE